MTITRRYPGSRPFADDDLDRLLFKGREHEKKALLHLILAEDLVLLYAKSGMGKSSLLNAGILKQLRDEEYFPVVLRLNDPCGAGLTVSIQEQISEQAAKHNLEVEGKAESYESLWLFFQNLELWRGNILLIPALIFDQFEEIFTLNSEDQRQKFINEIACLIHKRAPEAFRNLESDISIEKAPPLKIVISMREDYLGEMESVAVKIPQVMHSRFRLTAMTREQATQAIKEPAESTDDLISGRNFAYHPEAIEELLDFLGTRRERGGSVKSNEVEPFQLQIICYHLEDNVIERQRKGAELVTVSPGDLGGREGMESVIQSFYNNQIAQLPSECQALARQLCQQGLIYNGKRISMEEEQIKQYFKLGEDLLNKLVKLRLLRKEPRVGSVYYELSHDTLVAPILKERKEGDPYEIFSDAERKRDIGDYQEAFKMYERVTQLDSGYTPAYLNWATLLMKRGRVDEAEKVIVTAINNRVENAIIFHQLGSILTYRGDFRKAIEYYKKALEKDNNLVDAHIDIGNAYFQNKEYLKANEAYENALGLTRQHSSIDPYIYRQLARLRIAEKKYESVIEIFKQALQAYPESGFLFEDLVRELKWLGVDDKAHEICLIALEKDYGNDRFFFTLGDALYDLGDPENATVAYQKSASINPNESITYNNWGVALAEDGNPEEAIEKFQKTIQLDSRYAAAYLNWGGTLRSLGRDEEAIEKFQKTAELDPHSASAYFNWGMSLGSLGRHEEAIEKFQKTIELDPQFDDAYFSCGVSLGSLGRHEEATEKYQKVVELDPQNTDALFNWGVSLGSLGRDEEAAEKYQKVAELDPQNADALFNWGVSLRSLGRDEEATENYQKVVELDPQNTDALFNWGVSLSSLERHEEASESFRRVVELNPGDTGAYFNLGASLQNLGNYQGAIENYQKVVELDPQNTDALFNWGVSLGSLERHEEAIEKYRNVIELDPKSTNAFFNWGICLGNLERYDEAIENYRKVIEINADDADAYNNWGWSLRKLGRQHEAIEKYEKAVELAPQDTNILGDTGWEYYLLNDYDQSIKYSRKALAIKPDEIWIQCNLALALLHLGWLDEAEQEYKKAIELTIKSGDILEFERNAINDLKDALEQNPKLAGGKEMLTMLEKQLKELKDKRDKPNKPKDKRTTKPRKR